jgi:hypothetical protein
VHLKCGIGPKNDSAQATAGRATCEARGFVSNRASLL